MLRSATTSWTPGVVSAIMNGANRVASACCWKRHLVTSPLYMARSSPDSSQIETGSSRKTTRGGVAASARSDALSDASSVDLPIPMLPSTKTTTGAMICAKGTCGKRTRRVSANILRRLRCGGVERRRAGHWQARITRHSLFLNSRAVFTASRRDKLAARKR